MRLPFSLAFFALTGVVFLLQAFPLTGIVLMFMLAMFWSVLLVNAGMIGVAVEAAIGRVSRGWLLLPIAYFGGYWAVAAADHRTLGSLTASFAAANAPVRAPFDPDRQQLLFAEGGDGAWLTQHYGLPIAFTGRGSGTDTTTSHRMVDGTVCTAVRANPALQSARIDTFGFHDEGAPRWGAKLEQRFCELSMPERPSLPVVRIRRHEQRLTVGTLPVTRIVTAIAMPEGRRLRLLGGHAAPLSWIPMPVIGCGLNSGAPSWDCDAGFWRHGSTPIVGDRDRGEVEGLARALGLHRVAPRDRRTADPAPVLAKVAAVEAATLARQLAAIDAMIADPLMKDPQWDVGVVANRPAALASRADGIIAGVERAAAVAGPDRWRARESGRILAGLLARLPREQFAGYGPRILALYARADDEHWLWGAEALIRRLGDFGPGALPYLVTRRAMSGNVNNAGVEGLCRIGAPALRLARPALLQQWAALGDTSYRYDRMELLITLRRIGVEPPPPPDRHGTYKTLAAEWMDITPASPPRVCAFRAEEQARREEKHEGRRRSNLD